MVGKTKKKEQIFRASPVVVEVMMKGIEYMGMREMRCVGKMVSFRPGETIYGNPFGWNTTARWMLKYVVYPG